MRKLSEMIPHECVCCTLRNTSEEMFSDTKMLIKVITKLPNSEQSSKGEVKTHKYINRQNQSTTGKL